MKQFTLRIAYLGLENLQQHINTVEQLYGMKIENLCASSNDTQSYKLADLLFIDIKEGQKKIEEIMSNSAEYAEYVLYTDEESFKKLDNKFKNKFLDTWFSSDNMLDYRATTLVRQMYTIFDNEFSQKKFTVLTDNLPDVIWCKDLSGDHLDANTTFCQNSGKTKEQVLGRNDAYIWNIDADELAAEGNDCLNTDEIVAREQKTLLFDEQVKFDNIMIQYKTYKSCIIGRNGESIATIGLARDVTNIWNTHEDFKKIISRLPIPVMLVDADYKLVSNNESLEEIFKYPQEYLDNFSLEHYGNYFFKEDIILSDSHSATVQRSFTPAGTENKKYFAIQKSAIYNVFNIISGYFYIITDITDDHDRQEHLEKLAEIDELTQINNRKGLRRYFNDTIPQVMSANQSLSVFMIDIDYFKKFNDFYGHLEGDIIIKKIASILESVKSEANAQRDDIYVARFGGEEFIIVMKNFTLEKVQTITTKVEDAVAKAAIEHKMSDVSPYVTLSIGIAHYNKISASDDVSTIMKNADDALYKSKQTGRKKNTLVTYN